MPATPHRPTGADRRRCLRRNVKRIPAAFQAGELRGQGHIKNLSREGLFLRSDDVPERGSEIRVVFHDRVGSKVEIRGTVCWTTSQLPEEAGAKRGFGIHISGGALAYLEFYEQMLTR